MLKVLIADDEERVCKLIVQLIDWDALHMEVVGTAENGIQAAERVQELSPDILITDIRMPGCSGLELIQEVKKHNKHLEVVIISGYAYFSYAQAAIKYGVEDYLLKPIHKIELTDTLQKLAKKIMNRNQAQHLQHNDENHRMKAKHQLIKELLENDNISLEIDTLQKEYYLNVEPGIFQMFCLKLDYHMATINDSAKKVVYQKATNMITGNLKRMCYEVVFHISDGTGYGMINYPSKSQEDVRRILRDCLNQLTVQKSILGDIDFTIALGTPVNEVVLLSDSLKKCRLLIQERILVGTGNVIEKMEEHGSAQDQNILKGYSRKMLHAVEVLSVEEGEEAANELQATILKMRNVRGYEIYDLILSAATLFLAQADYKNRKATMEQFLKKVQCCGTTDQLFAYLSDLQKSIIQEIKGEREDEALRPIRLAKQYIQNHYKEQITLEEVSDAIGLSSGYFSTLFKKVEGEGFAKYLIHFRIEQAKILLRESNCSVADICKQVGYNDLKHFTRTFEKVTNLKPSMYRKLYG